MRTDQPLAHRSLAGGLLAAATVAVAVALSFTFAGRTPQARAASAWMSIDPPSQNIAPGGGNVTVSVSIHDVTDLASWEFVLNYNPAVLTYSAAQTDTTLLSTVGQPYCPAPIIDTTIGTVRLGCLTSGLNEQYDAGASGSGKLATVTFTSKSPGTSPLSFTKLDLGTPDSKDIVAQPAQAVIRFLAPGDDSNTLAATPTTNPVALTPTPIPGAPTPDPGLTLPPGASGSSAGPGSSGGSGTGPSGTGSGGRSGGSSSGRTGVTQLPPNGSSQGGRTGTLGTSSGANRAPHAGDGSATQGHADHTFIYAALLLGLCGVLLALGGRLMRRHDN